MGWRFCVFGALLVCGSPAWAVSGLMVHCDIPDAQVSLDGRALGTCTPGRFTVDAGTHKLLVRKDIDADSEWFYAGQVSLIDNAITKVEVTLEKHLTAAGMEREMARKEQEMAANLAREEQRRAVDLARKEQERAASAVRAERLSGEFVTVKGGCFQEGDPSGGGITRDERGKKVCVKGFKLAKYEVTQWQWRQVMGSNPAGFQACGEDCPVENVGIHDVEIFISKLNERTGQHYRLPTEAEWQYACRGGGKKQRYCGGDDLDAVAWYNRNSGEPHAVGGRQPNGLGLYDMSGNVWELICSAGKGKYSDSEQGCLSNATARWICLGGSWYGVPWDVRESPRCQDDLLLPGDDLGLRLAQDP